MKNVTVLSPSLNPGGVTKVTISYCKMLANNGVNLNLILTDDINYEVDDFIFSINTTSLGMKTSKASLGSGLVKFVHNCFKLPSALFFLLKNSNRNVICVHFYPIFLGILLKLFSSNKNIVFVFHTNVFQFCRGKNFVVRALFRFFLKLSSMGDVVVFLTKDVADEYSRVVSDKCNVAIIPNIYERVSGKTVYSDKFNQRSNILFVGRMSKEKNVDFILKVFDILITKGLNYNLLLVGDGPEMKTLRDISNSLPSKRYVEFLGFQKNVSEFYSIADVFILASEIEGFPVSLLEAIDFKLPIVCSNCNSGPKYIMCEDSELIDNNEINYETKVGKLLPTPKKIRNENYSAYASAITDCIDGRFKYSDKISEDILNQYSLSVVTESWFKLLK